MKKIISTLVAMLVLAGSVNAMNNERLLGKIKKADTTKTAVRLEILNLSRTRSDFGLKEEVVGWLGDPACEKTKITQGCVVIHDPNGDHYVERLLTRKKGCNYVGSIAGSRKSIKKPQTAGTKKRRTTTTVLSVFRNK